MQKVIQFISLLLFVCINIANGQVTMSGPTTVRSGATVTYSAISTCWQSSTGFCWGIKSGGGTLNNSCGSIEVGPGNPPPTNCNCNNSMSVTFANTLAVLQTTVIVEEKCGNFASTNVTIVPPLADNITTSPATQTINCGTTGTTLTASTPSGGDNTYTYQWQSSPNGSTWANINGATGGTYTPSGLSATAYFRVVVTSFDYTVTSSTATVTVTTPAITGGTISNASQAINYNTAPASITCSAASGGCSYLPYTYQWQSSANGTTWNNLNGDTLQNYQPGSLTATTYYRRAATNNGVTVYSTNTATVTVYPQLTTSISPAAISTNYNTSPGVITITRSGGNGSYTYKWQSSPNNSTWSDITGATAQTYTPANLTATIYYRAITTSNTVSVTSNVSTITVYPQLTTSISPASASINYNTSPGVITAARSGGNGAYTYKWQSSPDNSTWSDITGATAQTYTPGNLTATTYYRVITTSNTVSVTSNVSTITIYPQLTTSISPASASINYNTSPGVITAARSGGTGSYTYVWQSSPDNSTWSNIGGATGQTYTPGNLTATTYYRVITTSNTVSVTSNVSTITVYPQLTTSISPASASINYNTSPGVITAARSGGTGSYTYVWQSSPDNSTWNNIGVTTQNYTPGNLTATTYYRVITTSNSVSVTSNVSTITVYPQVTTSISPASASINYNTSPGVITATRSGGNGSYTYVWQSSPDNSTWNNIGAATAQTYTPGNLTATTYYRVITTSNTVSVTSNVSTITVYPQLTTSISPASASVNYNTSPGAIAATRSGGNGTYTYVWQSSPDNSTWNNVGATTQNYTPGNLTATTYYRVITTSNTVSATSNVSTITVYPQLTTSISPASASINYNTNPGAITATRSGGNGTYTYIWQSSPDNSTWSNIGGATAQTYTPGNLMATTYYRVITTSNTVSATSNVSTITVYPQLTTSISPASASINYNTSPGVITATRSGGNGTYTYVWQSSPDNSTWSNIGGAIGQNYTPGNLTATTYYRVITTSNTVSVTSNVSTITVYPQLTTSISPASASINYNTSPGVITATRSGGNGTYTYVWQSSPDNSTCAQPVETGDLSKPQVDNEQPGDVYPETVAVSNMTNGLATGAKARVLGTSQWLTSTTYYDDKGRAIQQISDNINGGKDIATSLYDFSGKLLSTNVSYTNPHSTTTPATNLLTMSVYDHVGRLKTIRKVLNNDDAHKETLTENTYDELGQLQTKGLGTNGTSSYLETLNYAYNIRGWLKGINMDYVQPGATGKWFGQELSYDYGFGASQLNGNIAGIKWKSKGDGIARSYGFTYDNVNRLTGADFNQQNQGSTVWTKDKVNFTVENLTYDVNGNIMSMKQWGQKLSTPSVVDDLVYHYPSNSNKLQSVYDNSNDEGSTLGDFKEPSANNNSNQNNPQTDYDYQYDANGNLTQDNNKHIDVNGITYNYLNLPQNVAITGKGNIQYVYDASGNKLRKIVTDNTAGTTKTTTTDYMGGLVYENDTLQFIGHEEGRIRAISKTGQPVSYVYDYFIKDHLGNVRMVLTEETNQVTYAATMETENTETENVLFSNIDNTRSAKPSGYPNDPTTDPNNYVSKLNAVNGQKIGPSLVLRVMVGDKIQIGAKAFYKSTGANTSSSLASDMVAAILNAFSGIPVIGDGSHTGVGTGSPIASNLNSADYQHLKEKDPNQNLEDKPKSYLNFVLFDDQFNLVDDNSGVKQVQSAPDELQTLATDQMEIKRTGFIYVYTSNESGEDVFFDNVVVQHTTGPLAEETHYYPFGLTMAGISAKAMMKLENKYWYNSKELQSNEFGDGSGLEWYDYGARMYDQQIARWHVIDPHSNNYTAFSPYVYVGNAPLTLIDPDGRDWFYYSVDGAAPTWNWREGHEYKTGVKDVNGKDVVLQGAEAAVVFNGFIDEKLGTKDGQKGYINGEDAITAMVTVYGPGGENDVHTYKGYTMSSNSQAYGVVKDGIYNVNYDKTGKSGSLHSHWAVERRGHVPAMNDFNPNTGVSYLEGVFIHSSNTTGFAGDKKSKDGKAISEGCLLIAPVDWDNFNDVMKGVNSFKLQLIRRAASVPLHLMPPDSHGKQMFDFEYNIFNLKKFFF